MIKWRDKKWLVGAIIVPAVLAFAALNLSKSPSQNSIGNVSNGFASQNQVGNNVFSVQTPHHFSETQSIKVVPKKLGGTYTLNLDNVANVKGRPAYKNW
jgi:hypothetical protein